VSATTFQTEFLGCKVALADAQLIRERLLDDGHSESAQAPAVRVVTTCCVTQEAVAKSRKAVRRAARDADTVYVTGCAANLEQDAFGDMPGNVQVVRGRPEPAAAAVSEAIGATGCTGGAAPPFARTRAYLKVQDGCSFGCSYCVIPAVRGQSRSRAAEPILAEAGRRAGQGHRELVLTGINLGCYRDRERRLDLAGLLQEVAAVDGIERVRLSSIEVNHVNDRLLRAVAGTPGVCPHLHVPLQSGSDRVLASMRRHYRIETFLRRLDRARELVGGLNLTSDVIVGHPAEDDDAFAATLDAVARAGFSAVHTFPYSPRPGTRDAGSDPVAPAVKRERSERVRALAAAQGHARRERLVGSRAVVLSEDRRGRGYAADYTPFVVAGAAPGWVVEVVASGLGPDHLIGTMAA
jgi:threonylcarbamoyladenosine tRNA methylthiotransferase MtaB